MTPERCSPFLHPPPSAPPGPGHGEVTLSRHGRPHRAQGLNACWRCSTKSPRSLRKPGPWYLAAEKVLLLHVRFHTSLHGSCDSPARAMLCHRRNACAAAEKFNWIFFVDYRLRISKLHTQKAKLLTAQQSQRSSSREACVNAGTELTSFSVLKAK